VIGRRDAAATAEYDPRARRFKVMFGDTRPIAAQTGQRLAGAAPWRLHGLRKHCRQNSSTSLYSRAVAICAASASAARCAGVERLLKL
jgi:hypothetical protein